MFKKFGFDPKLDKFAPDSPGRRVVLIVSLALAYFLAAHFGLKVSAINKFAALFWPPSGIALAGLLIFGPRIWPGIFIGAFLVNYSIGAPVLVALGIAAGNTLEGIAAAWV